MKCANMSRKKDEQKVFHYSITLSALLCALIDQMKIYAARDSADSRIPNQCEKIIVLITKNELVAVLG